MISTKNYLLINYMIISIYSLIYLFYHLKIDIIAIIIIIKYIFGSKIVYIDC